MIKLAFISGLCGRKEPLFKDFQFFLQLFLCKTLRLVCVRMIFTVIISIEHCSSQEDLKQLHINIHVYNPQIHQTMNPLWGPRIVKVTLFSRLRINDKLR